MRTYILGAGDCPTKRSTGERMSLKPPFFWPIYTNSQSLQQSHFGLTFSIHGHCPEKCGPPSAAAAWGPPSLAQATAARITPCKRFSFPFCRREEKALCQGYSVSLCARPTLPRGSAGFSSFLSPSRRSLPPPWCRATNCEAGWLVRCGNRFESWVAPHMAFREDEGIRQNGRSN